MLSPEPPRGLDLMTLQAHHRTNIELELSKNKGVLCRPSPGQSRFRANGSHLPFAADRTDSAVIMADFGTFRSL